MQELIIYGAGGFGREVNLLIRQINLRSGRWLVKGFCDDGKTVGDTIDGLPVLGGLDYLTNKEGCSVALAIADPQERRKLYERLSGLGLIFPNIIHPDIFFDTQYNSIGKGCVITAGGYFTTGIRMGDFVIVNLASTVGHDVVIGNFTSIMPGANISGNVSIGECVLVGTGAQILQNLSLGSDSKLGAGGVMTRSFGTNSLLKGVPAREK